MCFWARRITLQALISLHFHSSQKTSNGEKSHYLSLVATKEVSFVREERRKVKNGCSYTSQHSNSQPQGRGKALTSYLGVCFHSSQFVVSFTYFLLRPPHYLWILGEIFFSRHCSSCASLIFAYSIGHTQLCDLLAYFPSLETFTHSLSIEQGLYIRYIWLVESHSLHQDIGFPA